MKLVSTMWARLDIKEPSVGLEPRGRILSLGVRLRLHSWRAKEAEPLFASMQAHLGGALLPKMGYS